MDASRNKCVRRITKVYKGMRERCNNPNHAYYDSYGGKGVKVLCSRLDFIEWYLCRVGEIKNPHVDRKENDGHYEFSNMRIIPGSDNTKKMLKENPRWDVKIANMKKANDERSKEVYVDGILYASCNEAERMIGMSKSSIARIVKRLGTNELISKKVIRLYAK